MIEVIAEAGVYKAMWVRLRYGQLHQPVDQYEYDMFDAPANHCTFDGCQGKLRRKGLCAPHLAQLFRGERLTPTQSKRSDKTVKIRMYPFPLETKMVLR